MTSTSLDAGRKGLRNSSRLPKSHRLSRKALIQPLFDREHPEAKSFVSGSLRVLYRWVSPDVVGEAVPVQVGFAVGRSTGIAVVRNRVKRVLRDEYRRNQTVLFDSVSPADRALTVMVVVRKRPTDESLLRQDLVRAILRLSEEARRSMNEDGAASGPSTKRNRG